MQEEINQLKAEVRELQEQVARITDILGRVTDAGDKTARATLALAKLVGDHLGLKAY